MKRNTVHVAAVWTQVHLIVPHLIAITIGVNVPVDAVVLVQINAAGIIPVPDECNCRPAVTATLSLVLRKALWNTGMIEEAKVNLPFSVIPLGRRDSTLFPESHILSAL